MLRLATAGAAPGLADAGGAVRAEPDSLARCLLLALLLHLWLVLLLGNAPGGTAQPGQGRWGAINVTLGGSAKPDAASPAVLPEQPGGAPGPAALPRWGGAVRDSEAPALADPGAARLGRWAERADRADAGLALPAQRPPVPPVAELPPMPAPAAVRPTPPEAAVPSMPPATALPAMPPAAAVEPAPPAPPQPAPATAVLPALPAAIRPAVPDAAPAALAGTRATTVTVPTLPELPPALPEAVAPRLGSTLLRAPAQADKAAPAAALQRPAPLVDAPLRLPDAPATRPLPAPLPAPIPAPTPAPPALAQRPALQPATPPLAAPLPAPAVTDAPVPVATELPIPAPAPAIEPALRRIDSALTATTPVPAATAALPRPQPLAPKAAPAPVPPAPALSAPLSAAPATPANSALVSPAAPSTAASPVGADALPRDLPGSAPDAGARVGHDVATLPSNAASAPPRLNLELARPRGGELSRRSALGALPVLPRPPELPDKLARDIEKAARPDCRTAHSGWGLLAPIPLAVDALRKDGGCKW